MSDDREMSMRREAAARAVLGAFHDLRPRIPGIEVGDCHCNLLAEVALDAIIPVLLTEGRRRSRTDTDNPNKITEETSDV